jgi:sodium-dependent dicarboxylate transporter 2/3/5
LRTLQKIGLITAIIILVGMHFLPTSELLPVAARNMLGLLLAVIVLLVTEVFPLGVTCLAALSLMFIFGCVGSIAEATVGYTNKVLYFVVASFGISEALTTVPASKRMLVGLMTTFGQNISRLLFAIMLCVALLSSVISNVAAAAVFIPIIMKFLDVYEDEAERKRTARCFMLALPIASMIGGMMTPAGSSINLLAIGLLQKNAGVTVTFVEWMLIGIPLCAALLPFSWLMCCRVYRPAPLAQSKISAYLETIRIHGKMEVKEVYVLTLVFIMLVLWILSSWYPVLDITVVALLGLLLFFVPGFEVLTWQQFKSCVSWEAFFLIGTMISMGSAITSTGLSVWLANAIFPSAFPNSNILLVGFIALLTFMLLIPIPVAPALVSMLVAPLVSFSANIGANPCMLVVTLGLCACNCYFLPLDTVPLMTFSTGTYKMFDMPRVTVMIQLAMVILSALWIPLICSWLGV